MLQLKIPPVGHGRTLQRRHHCHKMQLLKQPIGVRILKGDRETSANRIVDFQWLSRDVFLAAAI